MMMVCSGCACDAPFFGNRRQSATSEAPRQRRPFSGVTTSNPVGRLREAAERYDSCQRAQLKQPIRRGPSPTHQ